MGLYWGYVVCFCSVLLGTMSFGIIFSFCEVIIQISQDLSSSQSTITWIGALPGCLASLLCPCATWLYLKVKHIWVIMMSGVITVSLSYLLISTCTDSQSLLLAYGILQSIGGVFIINVPFFLMEDYFPRNHHRHVFSTSVLACCYPLGLCLFNPLSYTLYTRYGWRNMFRIYSCLFIIIGSIVTVIYRKPKQDELQAELYKSERQVRSREFSLSSEKEWIESDSEDDDDDQDDDYGAPPASMRLIAPTRAHHLELQSSKEDDRLSTDDVVAYRHSGEMKWSGILVKLLGNNNNNNKEGNVKVGASYSDDMFSAKLSRVNDISSMTVLVLGSAFFLASFLKMASYQTPLFLLVQQMDSLGISQSLSSRSLLVVGVCELMSRLITSYLGDRIKGSILYIYVCCTVCLSLLNLWGAEATSYYQLMFFAAALGTMSGPLVAAIYSSSAEILDGLYVKQLFTVFRLAQGLGSVTGPTVGGILYEVTQSYSVVFYVNCMTYALSALLYICIIIISKVRPTSIYHQTFHQRVTSTSLLPLLETA